MNIVLEVFILKKVISLLMVLVLTFSMILPCVYAENTVTVSAVEEMLKGIDSLQQMQDKRRDLQPDAPSFFSSKASINRRITLSFFILLATMLMHSSSISRHFIY